jgi:hypothetical protein
MKYVPSPSAAEAVRLYGEQPLSRNEILQKDRIRRRPQCDDYT